MNKGRMQITNRHGRSINRTEDILKVKKLLFMGLLATLSLSTPLAWSEESPQSSKKAAVAMMDKDKQAHMVKMQENMLRLHEQMHKIMQTNDPKERERLTQGHLKMMQENMHTMDTMGDMMGHGMKMEGQKTQ